MFDPIVLARLLEMGNASERARAFGDEAHTQMMFSAHDALDRLDVLMAEDQANRCSECGAAKPHPPSKEAK
jgi:hypothetical protein